MAFGTYLKKKMEPQRIITIEWDMMDKSRFFSLSMLNSFTLRGVLYPFTVIKTRLQIQKRNAIYTGTLDAFLKILRYEGFTGLYKGFWINTIQIISGFGYITTYEKVRHLLSKYAGINDGRIKGFIAGGCGSLVGQTIITPFDVISQHMMVLGQTTNQGKFDCQHSNPLNIKYENGSRKKLALRITKELYRLEGVKGFYRGYFASLCAYVPSSGLWWMFYPLYSETLASVLPLWTSHMLIHCISGSLSGLTVTIITNPLDVIRARIQVQRMNSFSTALYNLWEEEKLGIFKKGLSARLVQSTISSFFIVLGYETLKRWSLHDHYKDKIRW